MEIADKVDGGVHYLIILPLTNQVTMGAAMEVAVEMEIPIKVIVEATRRDEMIMTTCLEEV